MIAWLEGANTVKVESSLVRAPTRPAACTRFTSSVAPRRRYDFINKILTSYTLMSPTRATHL